MSFSSCPAYNTSYCKKKKQIARATSCDLSFRLFSESFVNKLSEEMLKLSNDFLQNGVEGDGAI